MDDQPNVTQRKPSRFRPLHSFSLRTLFVVLTVFAVWMGWELQFIRERRDFLAMRDTKFEFNASEVFIYQLGTKPKSGTIPFWRRWLGDQTREQILLWDNSTDADRQKAAKLFPEAQIIQRAKQVLIFQAEQEPATH